MRIFDAHFHIIDPRFPLVANHGYLPEPFPVAQYHERVSQLGIEGGAIVSGSFQAFDQGYLVDALTTLGSSFVGVTQLPESASDAEIRRLDRAGVRALRFNLRRGGSEGTAVLDRMARRVHDLVGWHVELYVDSTELSDLRPVIQDLPSVSIDHLGLSESGLPELCELAARGVAIKATGFGRVDFEIEAALREIWSANPQALMFGTDLPSTRAPRPFEDADVQRVLDSLGEESARGVFYDNAARFYRLGD